MKKSLWLALWLTVGLAFLVSAGPQQDLGELAKKEKARREALAKQGKKGKVYTNEDLQNIKARLAIESSTGAADLGTPETSTEKTATSDQSTDQQYTESEEGSSEKNVEEQLKELRIQREEAEREAEEARKTIGSGGLLHTRNVGNQFDKAQEAERKLQELDQKIKELEEQQQKEEKER